MLARHKEEVFEWISARADDESEEEGEDTDQDAEMKDQ
jgi:hypothetical protein